LHNLDGIAVTSHSEGRQLLQRAGEALLHHIRWRVAGPSDSLPTCHLP
jgi:hypothetical protein